MCFLTISSTATVFFGGGGEAAVEPSMDFPYLRDDDQRLYFPTILLNAWISKGVGFELKRLLKAKKAPPAEKKPKAGKKLPTEGGVAAGDKKKKRNNKSIETYKIYILKSAYFHVFFSDFWLLSMEEEEKNVEEGM